MAKHRSNHKEQRGNAAQGRQSAQEEFQMQFQDLLKQRKYRQALEEIKKFAALPQKLSSYHQQELSGHCEVSRNSNRAI